MDFNRLCPTVVEQKPILFPVNEKQKRVYESASSDFKVDIVRASIKYLECNYNFPVELNSTGTQYYRNLK